MCIIIMNKYDKTYCGAVQTMKTDANVIIPQKVHQRLLHNDDV